MSTEKVLDILLLVVGSSVFSIVETLLVARKSAGVDGVLRYFDHYFFIPLLYQVGRSLTLPVWLVKKRWTPIHGEDTIVVVEVEKRMRPVYLLPSALLSLSSQALLYMGLILTRKEKIQNYNLSQIQNPRETHSYKSIL